MDLPVSYEILLAIIGILITCLVAYRQDRQNRKIEKLGTATQAIGTETKETTKNLETIGIETKETTKNLETIGIETKETAQKIEGIAKALRIDAITQENINRFFPKNDNEEEKYKLYFPGDYKQKTLPLINAGDSYAMYVISGLLGADLRLRPIPRNNHDISWLKEHELDCNAILLCDMNSALQNRFEFIDLDNLKDRRPNKNNLPCWFATFDTGTKYGKSFVINIHDHIKNIKTILSSQSEESCMFATGLKDHEQFVAKTIQQDYGIIARLSQNNYKYIVIAGIHGFGTVIAASFFDDLIRGKKDINEKYNHIFFGHSDFISIIQGDFDSTKFYVDRSSIVDGRVWFKDGKGWNNV